MHRWERLELTVIRVTALILTLAAAIKIIVGYVR
jgi:hypothetical protein